MQLSRNKLFLRPTYAFSNTSNILRLMIWICMNCHEYIGRYNLNNETWKHLLEKSVKCKNVNHGRRPDNWLYIKPGIPLVKFISNFNTICKYGALTSSYKAIDQPRMYIQHDNTLQNILEPLNYCYQENFLWIWLISSEYIH